MKSAAAILIFAAATATAQTASSGSLLPTQPDERCSAAPANVGSAAVWLDCAAGRVIPPSANGRVLRFRSLIQQPF